MEDKDILHFTVGSDFANLLASIAHEKLLYNLDIESTLLIFRDGLGISDRDIQLKLLSGSEYCLTIDTDKQEAVMGLRSEIPGCSYPILESTRTLESWLNCCLEDCKSIKNILGQQDYCSWGKYCRLSIEVDFTVKDFISVVLRHLDETKDKLYEEFIKKYEDCEDEYFRSYLGFSEFLVFCKDWIIEVSKKIEVGNFIITNSLGDVSKFLASNSVKWFLLKKGVSEIYKKLIDCIKILELEDMEDDYINEILPRLKKDLEIKEFLGHSILPIDPIEDNFDAAWLSPEGKVYGLCGEMNSMLHLQLVDLLKEDGIIPDEHERDGYSYLENQGWVKIHHNWILWCADILEIDEKTFSTKISRRKDGLTEKQIEVLVKYGKEKCSGFLKLGYAHTMVSTTTLRALPMERLKEIFSLYQS